MKEVIIGYNDNGTTNAIGRIVGTIVRCKDCTHYHAFKDYAYCTVINVKGKHPQPNDYCSYAEEK